MSSTTTELSQVIGDASQFHKRVPTTLGEVLSLIDVTAGRCAYSHAYSQYKDCGIVTGCFDTLHVLDFVRHGDLVTAIAQLRAVGTRSMLIQVDAYAETTGIVSRIKNINSKSLTHIVSAMVTFVAEIKPGSSLPPLLNTIPSSSSPSPSSLTKRQKTTAKASEETIDYVKLSKEFKLHRTHLHPENRFSQSRTGASLNHSMKKGFYVNKILMEDTRVCTRRFFLPRHLNFGGVVFGGEILSACESISLIAAARVLLTDVSVIKIKALSFWKPIPPRKVMRIVATVAQVKNSIAAVSVIAYVENPVSKKDNMDVNDGDDGDDGDDNNNQDGEVSHTGLFFVGATDGNVGNNGDIFISNESLTYEQRLRYDNDSEEEESHEYEANGSCVGNGAVMEREDAPRSKNEIEQGRVMYLSSEEDFCGMEKQCEKYQCNIFK